MYDAAHPFFLETSHASGGRRFGVHHPAAAPQRGLVVHVHAFAEEMNKSRHMAAQQSRAWARAGFDVLRVDLLGCGDSDGDFGDATWSAWVDDIVQAAQALRARAGAAAADLPLWLWGQRAGCLLAVEAARQLPHCAGFVFWQPVPAGKAALQQFLRLKSASAMLSGNAKGVTEGLRRQLAAGETVDIAGYALSPGLASGFEAAALTPPPGAGQVAWFELSTAAAEALSPAGQMAVERWRQAGWTVRAEALQGPAFWQTTEIESAPALIEASTVALEALHAERAARVPLEGAPA